MKNSFVILSIATCFAGATCVAQGPNMSPKDSVVLTDKEAFALMPPELIAASGVRQAMWSPDGQYVLLLREDMRITPEKLREIMGKSGPPPGNNIISIWDRTERRLIDAWKQPIGSSQVQDLQWLPGSSLAIAKVSVTVPPKKEGEPAEYHDGIIRISASTGSVKTISDSGATTSFIEDYASPVEPLILFREYEATVETSKDADGKEVRRMKVLKDNLVAWREPAGFSAAIPIPAGTKMINLSWSLDGTPVVDLMPRNKTVSKADMQRLAINLKNGRFTPVGPEFKPFAPASDVRPLRTKQVRMAVKEGETTRNVPFLWLESVVASMQPRAMVAANSDFGSLAPKADAVLYVSHGAAWVTPLFSMTKEEFLAALEASERTVALSKAKQLGLGLLMYAQDYDEKLPGADGEVNGKISPYLKNDSLFDGFVYTYGGGPLSGIEFPAETELGYVNGPGGRAIIYADGHAKWKKD